MTIAELIEKLEKARKEYGDNIKVEIDTGMENYETKGVMAFTNTRSGERWICVHSFREGTFDANEMKIY